MINCGTNLGAMCEAILYCRKKEKEEQEQNNCIEISIEINFDTD